MSKAHGLMVLLALAGCPAHAPVEPAPEEVSLSLAPGEPIRIEILRGVMAQVVPLVEAAAGRRFDEVPFAGLGTPQSLQAINLEDQMVILRAAHPELPEVVLHRMARSLSVHTEGIVGKYAMAGARGRLYVSAASLDAMVRAGQLAPEGRLDLLRLVLAHELVHGLQDEALGGLELFTRDPSLDGIQVARALTEGQAMWVEHQVAEELGLEELFWQQVRDGQGWGPEGLIHPGAFPIWWAYGQGYQAMAWLDAHGGSERIWQTLREPPRSSAGILWPDWEGPELSEPLEGLLDGIETQLTRGVWLAEEGRLGAYPLAQATAGLDPDRLRAPLEHLVGGRVREAEREDRSAELLLMRFDEPRWAEEIMGLVPEATAARDQARGWGETVAPWEDRPEDLRADESWYQRGSPAGAWGVQAESARVWMRRGSTVACVSVSGFRPGLRWGQALSELWARVEAADQEQVESVQEKDSSSP